MLALFAKNNEELAVLIKGKILEVVQNKSCFKSKVYEELKSLGIHYGHTMEVNAQLKMLIDVGVIEFTKMKPLKLKPLKLKPLIDNKTFLS